MSRVVQIELSEEAYAALEAAAAARGTSPQEEAAARLLQDLLTPEEREAAMDRALIEAGLMLKPPTRKHHRTLAQRYKTPPIQGKPISETILEERR